MPDVIDSTLVIAVGKFTNLTNLAALCIAGLLDLVWPLLGEGDTEKTQLVVICGLHIDVSLYQTLPLANK